MTGCLIKDGSCVIFQSIKQLSLSFGQQPRVADIACNMFVGMVEGKLGGCSGNILKKAC